MATNVKPIPDGQHHATPYLCARDAARAIEFYKKAFGAIETMRMAEPGGKIGHADLKIGGADIMLADEYAGHNRSPKDLGGTPVMIHLYVANVDAFCARAVEAGAKLVRPLEDQFYGDRIGVLEDPFGHVWMVATRKEDVSPEEMRKRFEAITKQ